MITISREVLKRNQVSGFKGLSALTDKYGIPVFEADSYFLTDDKTKAFMEENEFEIAVIFPSAAVRLSYHESKSLDSVFTTIFPF